MTTEYLCGEETPRGPCERPVSDDGPCYLHDEDRGVPEGHGAPKGNSNALKHGLYMDESDYFDAIEPVEQMFILAKYDELLDSSMLDFAPEWTEYQYDAASIPFEVEHETIVLLVPVPTRRKDNARALWLASTFMLRIMKIDAITLEEGMRVERTSHAKLKKPDSEGEQEFETVEQYKEHCLNLPLSRLIRDRSELLEYGGIHRQTG